MLTRRSFLQSSSLGAVATAMPGLRGAAAQAPRSKGRVLVVVELDGGNDGINTVVPFADDGYSQARKKLFLKPSSLLKIDDQIGFHGSLKPFMKLLQDGQLAVVQGVAYPNPNLSHFRSRAIYYSARRDTEDHIGIGWLGRGLDARAKQHPKTSHSLYIGGGAPPIALRGHRAAASSLESLSDFTLLDAPPVMSSDAASKKRSLQELVRRNLRRADETSRRLEQLVKATKTEFSYPDVPVGKRLELVARLLRAGYEAPVFYTSHGGFDTHANQLGSHGDLLSQLATSVSTFLADMKDASLGREITVLVFSEFGRTVKENGSAGTDHGTAGPMFVAGPAVEAGVYGTTPSMTDLRNGRLKVHVDFRRVYADMLEWLGLPAAAVLGGPFRPMGVMQRA